MEPYNTEADLAAGLAVSSRRKRGINAGISTSSRTALLKDTDALRVVPDCQIMRRPLRNPLPVELFDLRGDPPHAVRVAFAKLLNVFANFFELDAEPIHLLFKLFEPRHIVFGGHRSIVLRDQILLTKGQSK